MIGLLAAAYLAAPFQFYITFEESETKHKLHKRTIVLSEQVYL